MRHTLLSLLLISVMCVSACAGGRGADEQADGKIVLTPVDFAALPGWEHGNFEPALRTFYKSCERWNTLPPERLVSEKNGIGGRVADWKGACRHAAAAVLAKAAPLGYRQFFERFFMPYRVSDRGEAEGLFTGYYEIELRGSRTKQEPFIYPLYRRPPELEKDVPYMSRRRINAGELHERGLELAYAADSVKLFFLHVQGSGRLRLPDGSIMRVGYDGKNNCPYVSIGKYLIQEKGVDLGAVSAQKIKQWLWDHPEDAQSIMEINPSYVFFRELTREGPIGAQGVALTPEISLAVDEQFIPFGAPLWLDTTLPEVVGKEEQVFRRLMIAQDTGSAITGPVRGDVFFGAGPNAEQLAGHMKQAGSYYILLPKTFSPDHVRR